MHICCSSTEKLFGTPVTMAPTRKQVSKKRNRSLKSLEYTLILLNICTRLYAALYMIIADCDETFNYWEALNLLLRNFGKQTWEYSPEYAIRSYAYLIPYYIIAWPVSLLQSSKFTASFYQFYGLRIIALCGFTSYAEISLHNSLKKTVTTTVANWFLFFSTTAPGMSHAGVALLPSSFAMQCNLLAVAQIFQSEKTRSAKAITWFMIGGFMGWPFALALGIPYGLYALFTSKYVVRLIANCVVALIIILGIIAGIDSYFYSRFVIVPLNIVLYNVFGGEGEGPEIFGTEPFSYYILNLLLNFNTTILLAGVGVLAIPFLYKSKIFISALSPMLLWFAIFFLQPHKEERFLYPAYPLICLNAALFISKLYGLAKNIVAQRLAKTIFGLFAILTATVSVLRTLNLVENYSAPLQSFELINTQPSLENKIVNVCTGKEWYHFPNSFFLPDNYRLRFVKSGFDGLLPGDFDEQFPSLRQKTSHIPANMNNLNQFEEDKVIPFSECDYYIDNDEQSTNANEPRLLENGHLVSEEWEVLGCNKIIDPNGAHNGIGRILYVPKSIRALVPYNVEYLNFCALKKKTDTISELL